MDGNGRWAKAHGLPRAEGHRRGVGALRRAVRAADAMGIRYLTVYGFSTENWRRPAEEVADLFGLLRLFVRRDLAELHDANVRVRVIGDRTGLDGDVVALLDEAQDLTRRNSGLTFVVAFNYGGRQEIARAARALARLVRAGQLDPEAIDVEMLGGALDTRDIPDPDLVIRTSGELRISNFLPWQTAYSEFVFLPDHWPDFDEAKLRGAVDQFLRRDRRFGGRDPQAL
jgi:undecaprenyl diphosphate synthase